MLDSLARGAEFADIVRGYVERATAPLLIRIDALEAEGRAVRDELAQGITEAVRVAVDALPPPAEGPEGKQGPQGDRGADAVVASDEIARAVREYLSPSEGVLNPVAVEVSRYLQAFPPAQGDAGRDGADGVGLAGALIDRDGGLVLTLTDGTTRDLGQVVGPAGADGADGAAGGQGPQGEPGEAGPMGERGFGLDDFDTELSADGRSLILKFVRGDTAEFHEIALPEGPPGKDGRGFQNKGTYEPDAEYGDGDIVTLNGASFVALTDAPGACPGPGWQMWSRQGKPGKPGDPGEPGKKGDPGPRTRLVGGRVDPERMELVLVQDDGETVSVDLYPIAETIRAAQ